MTENNQDHENRQVDTNGSSKGILVPVWTLAVLIFIAFAGGAFASYKFLFYYTSDILGINTERMTKKLTVLESQISRYFLYDIDGDDLENGVYKGLVSALGDKYSQYYTKEEYDELTEADSGIYKGIGVSVSKEDDEDGYVEVVEVFKDNPAYNAGVKVGDFIIEVNGKNTYDMELTDVVKEIKTSDDPVVLKILRGEEELEINVEKTDVVYNSVKFEMKEDQIAYISVSQFNGNTAEQFSDAIDALEEEEMQGLIIDLRDNGGGYLDVCIDMLSRILPKDELIVYTEDKNSKKVEYNSKTDETVDVPIVLLVNGNTASASEIMTGCLKSYNLATVIGTKTYGKGIVQSTIPLTDGSAIKLTVSSYFTPDGVCIHGEGIEPDVEMEMTDEEWSKAQDDPTQDDQIKKAVELLTQTINE